MCHILTVEVVERFQSLHRVHSSILFPDFAVLFAHLRDAFVDVLEVDAEDIFINDFRVVVFHDVLVLQLLVPLDLLLHRFHFLLV